MNAMPSLSGSIGDYRIIERLGAGGMGEVYRAVHTRIGRQVAIKILSPAMHAPVILDRFKNEARLQASLHHPNIATLYDFVNLAGQPSIVMEYVDGQTLADRIRATGGMSIVDALAVFEAVLEAAAYVHDHRIVHRDLKPTNIRISGSGIVKLLDFGIAKGESSPGLTEAGNVAGTLQYLSPEQLKGEAATPRSDVWALGILLHEMVTGRVPFEAKTIGELLDRIANARYVAPSALRASGRHAPSGLARETDRVLDTCLRRDPRARFSSARELLVAVRQLRAHGSSACAPAASTPLLRRLHSWLMPTLEERWPFLAGAGGLVLATVVAMTFMGTSAPTALPHATPDTAAVAQARTGELGEHEIAVSQGTADVYVNGVFVGRTPCVYKARRDETVQVVLKQPGFQEYRDTFRIGEKKVWTLPMKRIGEQE